MVQISTRKKAAPAPAMGGVIPFSEASSGSNTQQCGAVSSSHIASTTKMEPMNQAGWLPVPNPPASLTP